MSRFTDVPQAKEIEVFAVGRRSVFDRVFAVLRTIRRCLVKNCWEGLKSHDQSNDIHR